MRLDEYVRQQGPQVKRVIAEKTGLRWATIHDIAQGTTQPKPDTARAIEEATGGAVTAIELLGLVKPTGAA